MLAASSASLFLSLTVLLVVFGRKILSNFFQMTVLGDISFVDIFDLPQMFTRVLFSSGRLVPWLVIASSFILAAGLQYFAAVFPEDISHPRILRLGRLLPIPKIRFMARVWVSVLASIRSYELHIAVFVSVMFALMVLLLSKNNIDSNLVAFVAMLPPIDFAFLAALSPGKNKPWKWARMYFGYSYFWDMAAIAVSALIISVMNCAVFICLYQIFNIPTFFNAGE